MGALHRPHGERRRDDAGPLIATRCRAPCPSGCPYGAWRRLAVLAGAAACLAVLALLVPRTADRPPAYPIRL